MFKKYINPEIKILIADDAGGARAALRHQLAKLGLHNVVEASDGEEAVQKLGSEHGFTLAILDAQMPGLQGTEMLKRIEGDKRMSAIPLIMAATHGEWEDLEVTGARLLGHLPKPVMFEELAEQLGVAFAGVTPAAVEA